MDFLLIMGVFALIAFIICGCITQGIVALIESCSCCCEPQWVWVHSKPLNPAVSFISLDMFFEKEQEDLNIQNV